jgi:peptidoglycan/xylan/chitin deacetylase (PgdA/CDA1 family)
MYHSVSGEERCTGHPYFRTATDPQVFRAHLQFLHDNGFKVLDLGDPMGGGSGLGKPVILTFDDGFLDFYTEAFPLLHRYGFSATVFLPTAYIGDTAKSFNGTQCLTWSQVRELQGAGIHFGSHTVTHPQLKTLTINDIREEVHCSKQTIEEKLGTSVKSFAYPYAFPEADRCFKQRLQVMLEEAGYENGVCTSIGTAGPNPHSFFLKRLPVNSLDDPRLFKAKLEGGYDWLYTLQYAAKLCSRVHNNESGDVPNNGTPAGLPGS